MDVIKNEASDVLNRDVAVMIRHQAGASPHFTG